MKKKNNIPSIVLKNIFQDQLSFILQCYVPQIVFLLYMYFACSKKKRCVIYGKWTECMWSVDPHVYEAHRKLEKKGATDTKKQKQV